MPQPFARRRASSPRSIPIPAPAAPTSTGLSRRRLIAGMGALAGAALVSPRSFASNALDTGGALPSWTKGRPHPLAGSAPRHLVWVWQFRHDGDPVEVRDRLAANGLGIVVKTHDGSDWMSEYDDSPTAVYGPGAVADFARFFEDGGVPFHAWALVKGLNPEAEAQMAADVLSAGARSIFLDLEAHPGFWEGEEVDAGIFGEALRIKQPNARISTSIDPRPWEIDRIPLDIFAAFSDEISPQAYWGFFNNDANATKYKASGSSVPDGGISASFVIGNMMERLAPYNRPIHPIGDGTVTDIDNWREFIDDSYSIAGAETVSLWRYGVATDDMLALLRDTPPRVTSYVVQPGDTLGTIAAKFGTTVNALAATNGITNINVITVGQRLVLPSGANIPASTPIANGGGSAPAETAGSGGRSSTWPPAPSWHQATTSSGTYEVQPGDSLFGIAIRHGVTLEALAEANGIDDPNHIRIGQVLVIP
ncbi:MAG: LysM peptidoglycan-binding domain-containing protein [Dehalococcoidia bacterium]|nr:LysM peptidoglycan-binding domain-containing protein [Dehalococcoidia bacterium]